MDPRASPAATATHEEPSTNRSELAAGPCTYRADKNMVEPDDINRIQAIFLHPERCVTVAEAAHLLRCNARMTTIEMETLLANTGDARSTCVLRYIKVAMAAK